MHIVEKKLRIAQNFAPNAVKLNDSSYWANRVWMGNEPSFVDGEIQENCMDICYYSKENRWGWNDVPDDIIEIAPFFSGRIGYIWSMMSKKRQLPKSDLCILVGALLLFAGLSAGCGRGMEATGGVSQVTAAGEMTQKALNETPVGGIVYVSQNLQSKEQVQKMLENLQSYSMERIGLPLLLCADEDENGVVISFRNLLWNLCTN